MNEQLEMLEDFLSSLDYESRLSYLLELGIEEEIAQQIANELETDQLETDAEQTLNN